MKVLIISYNCIGNNNNSGKTFKSLFKNFKKEELCQLYIYPSIPDVDYCNSYYRITDRENLFSLFTFKKPGREIKKSEIKKDNGLYEDKSTKNLYNKYKKIKKIARDFVWFLSPWFNIKLKKWLKQQNPTCIFADSGESIFFYKILLRCKKYLGIPMMINIQDEHYFLNKKGIYQFRLKRIISKVIKRSCRIITICEYMKKNYSDFFNKPTESIMTGSDFSINYINNNPKEIKNISYIGNMSLKRYENLYQIGCSLDRINKKYNKNVVLNIYGNIEDENITTLFNKTNSIKMHGFVKGKEYELAYDNSDLFIHTESFDKKNIEKVKNSISTKIPSYLNSGKCVLAYGPSEVASIKYLKDNDAAYVITDKNNLDKILYDLINEKKQRDYYINNALTLVLKNHDTYKNSHRLHTLLCNCSKKIIQINCSYMYGSTDKIVYDIHSQLLEHGYNSYVYYGRGKCRDKVNSVKVSTDLYSKFSALLCRITGITYGWALFSTLYLILKIKKEKPNIVHLQCINGNFVNIYRLVNWLNKNKINTVLTLHAEFMYTANCGHAFECNRWLSGCGNCPHLKNTNSYFFDNTHISWKKMKKSFQGFDNLVVVSVSPWLENRAKKSPILLENRHEIIYNGIDTNVFNNKNLFAFKNNFDFNDKKIVLHVTAAFNPNVDHPKGGYYILKLGEILKKENCVIIVIGRQDIRMQNTSNIIFLGRITNQNLLSKYYQMANVTVLTSKKETFSMPVAESLCCGTPVVGFKAGAPEQIALKDYSKFVDFGDIQSLYYETKKYLKKNKDKSISKLAIKEYSKECMYSKYLKLYNEFLN